MLNRNTIHYLKETALHLGLFVEGPITENGIVVSFFNDDTQKYIFTGQTCPCCDSFILFLMNSDKHKYICLNDECQFTEFLEKVLGEYKVYTDYDDEVKYIEWYNEMQHKADNIQYNLRKYKNNEFKVYEELDYFLVVVNEETYMLNSYIDVEEFIMNYNLL
jgi:hypothetical protein